MRLSVAEKKKLSKLVQIWNHHTRFSSHLISAQLNHGDNVTSSNIDPPQILTQSHGSTLEDSSSVGGSNNLSLRTHHIVSVGTREVRRSSVVESRCFDRDEELELIFVRNTKESLERFAIFVTCWIEYC